MKQYTDIHPHPYTLTPARTQHIYTVIFKEQPEPFLTVKHAGPPERSMTIMGGFRHLKRTPDDLSM